MVGFMRKPQIINDPNAAPAEMRADDVDLQAQEGDFIMGYPAMKQSGARVRSLVEQAAMKAKNAGVKTKGYKKGDKVDILVHNKEMHIPQEIIPYIDGGYTTLKKLNQPSKYDEGDTVKEGYQYDIEVDDKTKSYSFDEPLTQEGMTKFRERKGIQPDFDKYTDDQKFETLDQLTAPTKGHDKFLEINDSSLPFVNMYGTYGEQVWSNMKIRLSDMFKNYIEQSNKPVNKEVLYQEYIETVKNIRKGIETSSNNSINLESLMDTDFLKNSHKATRTHMKLNNLSKFKTGKELPTNITKKHKSLVINYPYGTNIFNNTHQPEIQPEIINAKFDSSDTVNRSNLMKQYMEELDNPNKVYINSSGGTGSIAGVNQNLALSQGYKKLFQYLQQVEDFRDSAYREPTKDELYSVGFGHQLTPDELEDFKNGKTINKIDALGYLSKDILNAEALAAMTYDKFLSQNKFKGQKFKDLDDNRKSMLIDMAFNMGSNSKKGFGKDKGIGLAEYDGFMTAIFNNDYNSIQKEHERNYTNRRGIKTPLKHRNNKFSETFIEPYLISDDNTTSMDMNSVIKKRVLE